MFAINQALLYGKQIPAEKHISDSKMFHRLAGLSEEGKVPVYGKNNLTLFIVEDIYHNT